MVAFTTICLILALILTVQTVLTSMQTAQTATNARTKGAAQRRIIDGIARSVSYILQIFKAAK